MKAIFIAIILASMPMQLSASNILDVAQKHVGLSERNNRKALKKMLGVDPVKTQWCGAALAYFARKAGYKPPSGHNVAASWSRFGRSVSMRQIKRGDVVVLRGHVTVFTRAMKGKICGVGGNQSNAIKESCYKTSRVVAVRRAR